MAKKKNMGVPAGRAPLRGEGPQVARGQASARRGDAKAKPPGSEIIRRRHRDWIENQIRWRWLLDSYEGGNRYIAAEYGPDRKGRPLRNLIRHKREYPDALEFPNTLQGIGATGGAAGGVGVGAMMGPYAGMLGADPTATAQDDEYEYRRSRTTPPNFVDEVVSIHLGKIYDQEVSRTGPDDLTRWWLDCDGTGTPIGEWMRETIAPLLLVCGKLDVVFDRPRIPSWAKVNTKADEIQYGLDRVVAAYILPENMVWWRNDPAGNYLECVVREYWSPTLGDPDDDPDEADAQRGFSTEFPNEPSPKDVRYRHWTATTVTLYDADGEVAEPEQEHGYPCVPIVCLRDRLAHRTPMTGKSRYEFVAHCMRDYYNRDSELILSDTLQANPLLSGPEEFCNPDQTINVGPQFILPMKKIGTTNDGGYQGWMYVTPSKEPAESIRKNKQDIREQVDRAACLMKPAGVTGTTGGTVSQSGYSKEMDAETGNKLLSDIAKSLAKNERLLAEFHLACSFGRAPTPAERKTIAITYPARFQLKQGQQILNELVTLVQICALEQQSAAVAGGASAAPRGSTTPPSQAGGNPPMLATQAGAMASGTTFLMPTVIAEMFGMYARATFPGRDPSLYEQIDAEAKAYFHLAALPIPGTSSAHEALSGHGTEEATAGEDATGQSAATSISPATIQVN